MPTNQTIKTLKLFRKLKKEKDNYSPEQYLKELNALKLEIDAQFSVGDLSKSDMQQLSDLLAHI